MTTIDLFCSDLDGTLLGNPEGTRRFSDVWLSMSEGRRPLLTYASGRLVQDVIDLLATGVLPWPDYIIGGVGTQIYDGRRKRSFPEFNREFARGWNLPVIERIVSEFPGISRQPEEFLHAHKSSWYLHHAPPELLAGLQERLEAEGMEVCLVYSSARHLDILPANTNKGSALRWLCGRVDIPLDRVLVAGDTGNDSSMFLLPGVNRIVVENAQPELREALVQLPAFNATRFMADGVMEGLKHFGVIPVVPPVDRSTLTASEMDPTLRMLFLEDTFGALTSAQRGLIATAYRKALVALRKNITPLGFSACSIDDNEVTGTDENYRSVWARDGSITIIGTADLNDPDIRAAQEATLRTLLDRLGPNGQVPANVRLDGGLADYSGIGGICSIDGALWTVIAFYNYVRKAGHTALLDEYGDRLKRVMDWLGALDSNNDGLLETPEAGDWMDLFGLSYHVLYDEVLWFRATVCYGRLLELQEDFEAAAEHHRRSQRIRSRILESFWPSTNPHERTGPISFADQQFSLGDARYLLAEIRPFGFNWRCDVIGNIQAFMSNVLDIDRARVAFRFMWGVGVNEPYPVANLYPAVQSGDADWRSYYLVNLLNLPGHYHNGGTWPFIGGMWVRFIHRLGLYDVACHELFKLAEVNRLGKNQEWEFNEWIHSRTGRPMGKAFQAWSAAAFIHACQELQIRPDELGHE